MRPVLSGTSGDLRDVLEGRSRGDDDYTLVFDVFVHTLVRDIGAMVAGGLDVLVSLAATASMPPRVRGVAAERRGYLGVELDAHANDSTHADGTAVNHRRRGRRGGPTDPGSPRDRRGRT